VDIAWRHLNEPGKIGKDKKSSGQAQSSTGLAHRF